MKSGLGNLTVDGVDNLAAIVRNRLNRIQYRPELIPGFLEQTGLSPDPATTVTPDRSQPFNLCS